MNHAVRADSNPSRADTFLTWLATETTSDLRRDFGNVDAAKKSVILYVDRAYGARLPEEVVGRILGSSVVSAGYDESEQELLFDLLESYAAIASGADSRHCYKL